MNTSSEIYSLTSLPSFLLKDFFSIIFFVLIGLYFVFLFKKKRSIVSLFYYPFLVAKFISLIAFIGLYYFYFKGGDTFAYFMGAEMLRSIFLESPIEYFKLIFSTNSNLKPLFEELLPYTGYKSDYSAFIMIKIVSVFNIITFNSYWAISVIFCFASFFGSWIFYEGIVKMFGNINQAASIFIVFFPSVLLWTSGILKDTLCYSLLGLIIYQLSTFNNLKVDYKRLIILVGLLFVLFHLKFYIVITFCLAYFLYCLSLFFLKKISINQILFFSGTLIVGASLLIWDFTQDFSTYKFLVGRIKDFHFWHALVANQGYQFEGMKYDVISLISKIPESIYVALYRPNFWEIKGVSMLIPVIESLFLLFLGGWVILKINVKAVKILLNKPELFLAIFFVVFLATTVGMIAYSFGALSRYRVPLVPFYLILMFKLLELTKKRTKDI